MFNSTSSKTYIIKTGHIPTFQMQNLAIQVYFAVKTFKLDCLLDIATAFWSHGD